MLALLRYVGSWLLTAILWAFGSISGLVAVIGAIGTYLIFTWVPAAMPTSVEGAYVLLYVVGGTVLNIVATALFSVAAYYLICAAIDCWEYNEKAYFDLIGGKPKQLKYYEQKHIGDR